MKKNKESPIENYITILKWLSEKDYIEDWELLLKEFMVEFIKDFNGGWEEFEQEMFRERIINDEV
tara:strand:+ start:4635 stop:4829 length:195 start_codon:yes stop_codon:yes gene_type:complete